MTFSALMTMTQSPTSQPGVNSGLFLPRRTLAISDDMRPRRSPAASTTYHFLAAMAVSSAFGIQVFCPGIIGMDFNIPCSMRTATARPPRGTAGAADIMYASELLQNRESRTARMATISAGAGACGSDFVHARPEIVRALDTAGGVAVLHGVFTAPSTRFWNDKAGARDDRGNKAEPPQHGVSAAVLANAPSITLGKCAARPHRPPAGADS